MASSGVLWALTLSARATRYVACIVLACLAAVLTAVPIFGQTATVTLVGAGDIASCDYRNDEATARLVGTLIRRQDGTLLPRRQAKIITIGDNAYPSGTRTQFANCYDNYRLSDGSIYDSSRENWWGRYKARTMPTPGNHDYKDSPSGQPYFDYFRARNGFKQPAAPVPPPGLTPGKGYYSYDLGSWHIVALNSNKDCTYVSCGSQSAQADWLRNDLASHQNACTLAYFHHPLYASGTGGDTPEVKPLWQILYNNHAEIILNGHDHRYERLARINPDGQRDSQNGIRPIIVGTGGQPGEGQTGSDDPNSQIQIFGKSGLIKLRLGNDFYKWTFIAVDGTANGKVMDSGSESCH